MSFNDGVEGHTYIFRYDSNLLVSDADILGHVGQGGGEERQVPCVT